MVADEYEAEPSWVSWAAAKSAPIITAPAVELWASGPWECMIRAAHELLGCKV